MNLQILLRRKNLPQKFEKHKNLPKTTIERDSGAEEVIFLCLRN